MRSRSAAEDDVGKGCNVGWGWRALRWKWVSRVCIEANTLCIFPSSGSVQDLHRWVFRGRYSSKM